jgi:hypothetical protein
MHSLNTLSQCCLGCARCSPNSGRRTEHPQEPDPLYRAVIPPAS